jgi:hypothetical protein
MPRKWAIGSIAAVAAAYTLLTAALFAPWLMQFSTALLGPPEDNLQDFWNLWHAVHASRFFHSDGLQFPYGMGLYFHSFSYPAVAATMGLTHWLGSDRATLIWLDNAAQFASFPLAATGAYYVVRRFVPSVWAALIGGFIFAFNPSHVAHAMHHAHVTHIEFIPLFVLAYLNGLEKRNLPWLLAAAVFGALGALSCWYYMFYAAYFVVFHAAYKHWHDKEKLAGFGLKAPVIALGGMALLLSPLIVAMLMHSGGVGSPGGSDAFVADIEAFVAFPTSHVFAGWSASFWARAHKWTSNNTFEGAAYLGLVNLAVMAWLWRRSKRQKDELARYLFWGMAVFGVLAMGDCIHAFGFDTLIPIPGIALNHLPFFNQMRTPSRVIVLMYLFLAIGVAYGLTLLAAEWRAKKWGRFALAGIAALIVFDFAPVRLEYSDARCPKALDVIARDREANTGVLNLPLHNAGDWSMFYQTCHGKPIVVAAVTRSGHPPLTDLIDNRNLAVQRQQLIAARVKYLVLDNRTPWETEPNPAKYAFRRWVVKTVPALARFKAIAVPVYQPPIPKAAYERMFPAVSRDGAVTVLKVQ